MIQFSTPPNDYRQSWAAQFLSQVQQALGFCVKNNEATGRVILQSPNGKAWAVSVDDSGLIVVTAINGSER